MSSEQRTELLLPKIALLFELSLEIGKLQDVGAAPRGKRLIAPIEGGSFQGPKLKGTVIPGGADWILIRPNGVRDLNVRLTLRTDSGHLIYLTYRGIDDTKDYFRTTAVFETAAEQEGWLNNIVAVGIGRRAAKGPVYTVYAVL